MDTPPDLAAQGGWWFRASVGALELHLGIEEAFRPARKAHPDIVVDDLGGLVTRLSAAEVPVVYDTLFPGNRRIYAAGAFGNRLGFLAPER